MDKPERVQIPITMTKEVICQKCGGRLFDVFHAVRVYPGGLLTNGRPVTMTEQTFVCGSCGMPVNMAAYTSRKDDMKIIKE